MMSPRPRGHLSDSNMILMCNFKGFSYSTSGCHNEYVQSNNLKNDRLVSLEVVLNFEPPSCFA